MPRTYYHATANKVEGDLRGPCYMALEEEFAMAYLDPECSDTVAPGIECTLYEVEPLGPVAEDENFSPDEAVRCDEGARIVGVVLRYTHPERPACDICGKPEPIKPPGEEWKSAGHEQVVMCSDGVWRCKRGYFCAPKED